MEERRHAERYPCEGSVELQQGDIHNRLWGHLGDISRMGFYVSSFGTWPVHAEARFKLQVGDLEVAGVAVVAASYPGVGMGLSFVELSPDEQAKLDRIL